MRNLFLLLFLLVFMPACAKQPVVLPQEQAKTPEQVKIPDAQASATAKRFLDMYQQENCAALLASTKKLQRDQYAPKYLVQFDSLVYHCTNQDGLEKEQVLAALHLVDDYLFFDPRDVQNFSLQVSQDAAKTRLSAWVASAVVTDADLEWLRKNTEGGNESKAYLSFKEIQKFRSEDREKTKPLLKYFVSSYPKSELTPQALLWLQEVNEDFKDITLTVGVILPLSGKYKIYGDAVLKGVECAAGIYKPCKSLKGTKLLVRDSEANPEKAVAAVDELQKAGVQVIVGPLSTNAVTAAAKRAEHHHLPMIMLSQLDGVVNNLDYVFRNSITPESQVKTIIDFALHKRNLKRFLILHPQTSIGKTYAELFRTRATEAGGVVVGVQEYASDQMGFVRKLQHAQREKKRGKKVRLHSKLTLDYDALFIPDSPYVASYLAPVLSMLGVKKVQLLGTARWDNQKLIERGGKYVEGALFTSAFSPNLPDVSSKEFIDRFTESYKFSPTLLEALGYDSLRMVMVATEKSGSPSRQEIAKSLRELKNFPGVTGVIDITDQHDSVRTMRMLTVLDGEIQAAP
ncbi:MAG: hypothetical protein COX62_04250 [Deltaproteobacteria bacterium CG_4_10_14_0_2_um_filter_43_8]|nr:MAG: hypothetical protein COX62_04250 [Deltaproteobacteria bacterium CG_4_10_14_0_2_um_filter_43_8]